MQSVSSTYKELLRNERHRKECKVEIGGLVFGMDRLIGLRTDGGLFRNAAVGKTVARQIDLSVFPGDAVIPRMAEMRVSVRLVSEEGSSEWIPKGTFYIDTRRLNRQTGVLDVRGYDAMLKAEQTFLTETTEDNWPKPMDEVVAEIASRIGVEIDERTVISKAFMVEYPNDLTMREILGYIAVAHAGNFIISDAGKLRLVGLADIPTETSYLVSEDGDVILFGDTRIIV